MILYADYGCYLTQVEEVALNERSFYNNISLVSSEEALSWKQINKDEYDNYMYQISLFNYEPTFEYFSKLQDATDSSTSKINEAGLTSEEALQVQSLYPEWAVGLEVKVGERYQYDDKLWEVVQEHTTQENWKPGIETSSMWKVVDVEHEGTEEDPIPYNPPMELFNGKYYTQNEILYKCNRDSEISLSQNLSDLVNIYVEIV